MPIVTRCTAPGCRTLTLGPLCVEHDLPVTRGFVRGRPFTQTAAPFTLRLTSAAGSRPTIVARPSERAVAARLPLSTDR